MSHRLQLLLCSFRELWQIQTALRAKNNTQVVISLLRTRTMMAKITNILTYFLSIQVSTGKIRFLYCEWLSFTNSISTSVTDRYEIDLEHSCYLSAICGMMKCCPFLWSTTEPGHDRKWVTQKIAFATNTTLQPFLICYLVSATLTWSSTAKIKC